MKYYYIYKITNLLNNKIYIGKRTTKNKPEEDNYLGSGKMIRWAINKYGKENFKKDILELCTKDNLSEREIYYIELYNCRNNEIGYNIIEGGYGVGDLCHDMKTYYNPETDQEIRIKETENPPEGFIHGRRPFTEECIKKMARPGKLNGMYGVHRYGKDNPFYNKKHTEETKQHLSDLQKGCNYYTNINTLQTIRIYKGEKVPENYILQKTLIKQLKEKKDTETINKILGTKRKESWKNRENIVCPYCGKVGRGAGFYQWHGEKCENHPTLGEQNKLYHKQILEKQKMANTGKHKNLLGKICINNGIHNKFINREDLHKYPDYKIGKIKKK